MCRFDKATIKSITVTEKGDIRVEAKGYFKPIDVVISLKDYPDIKVRSAGNHMVDGLVSTKDGFIQFHTFNRGGLTDSQVRFNLKNYPEVMEKLAQLAGEQLQRVADKLPIISKVVADKLKGKPVDGMKPHKPEPKEVRGEQYARVAARIKVPQRA